MVSVPPAPFPRSPNRNPTLDGNTTMAAEAAYDPPTIVVCRRCPIYFFSKLPFLVPPSDDVTGFESLRGAHAHEWPFSLPSASVGLVSAR